MSILQNSSDFLQKAKKLKIEDSTFSSGEAMLCTEHMRSRLSSEIQADGRWNWIKLHGYNSN